MTFAASANVVEHVGARPVLVDVEPDTLNLDPAAVEAAITDIFDQALALGGTLSGEHGTGIAKSCYLEKETSPATILYSRRLKAALDPNNILNPGKIIGG
jgi:FAD/FMN-containing dehydrogenase